MFMSLRQAATLIPSAPLYAASPVPVIHRYEILGFIEPTIHTYIKAHFYKKIKDYFLLSKRWIEKRRFLYLCIDWQKLKNVEYVEKNVKYVLFSKKPKIKNE